MTNGRFTTSQVAEAVEYSIKHGRAVVVNDRGSEMILSVASARPDAPPTPNSLEEQLRVLYGEAAGGWSVDRLLRRALQLGDAEGYARGRAEAFNGVMYRTAYDEGRVEAFEEAAQAVLDDDVNTCTSCRMHDAASIRARAAAQHAGEGE